MPKTAIFTIVTKNYIGLANVLMQSVTDNGKLNMAETFIFLADKKDAAIELNITANHLVDCKNLQKIDFIKMDIEGAEIFALKWAVETIRKFKPKLAISLYHNLTDFFQIPKFIDGLNLEYKFYIDHFTHSAGETVLYAKAD